MASRASSIASRTASRSTPGGRLIVSASPAADAAEAPAEAADAAEEAFRGEMRTPRSSMWMSMPSLGWPGFRDGFSMRITGSRSGAGGSPAGLRGEGGRGALGVRAAGSSMVSEMLQLNGGSLGRMVATIISSTDSTMKRRQLMPTSQLA
jgi:hypothetical protein